MRLLLQRVHADRATGITKRAGEIPVRFHPVDEADHALQKQTGQPLLCGDDPLFVESGNQTSLIEIHGVGKTLRLLDVALRPGRGLNGRLEAGDIGGHGVGIETDGEPVGAQDGIGGRSRRFELVTQGGERDAEAVASCLEGALGPEEIDEHLTRMHLAEMIGEEGEEGADLLGFEAGDEAVPLLDLESSQEGDVDRFVHGADGLLR